MNILLKPIDMIYNWARANSLTPLIFSASCCSSEILSLSEYSSDNIYFDTNITSENPRNADLLIVAGIITHKNAPALLRLYEQMPEQKYVIAAGACACSGGAFKNNSYTVISGADKIIPVDIYLPGCPPKAQEIQNAINKLKKKIMEETISKRSKYLDSHTTNFVLSENQEILINKNMQRKEKIGN